MSMIAETPAAVPAAGAAVRPPGEPAGDDTKDVVLEVDLELAELAEAAAPSAGAVDNALLEAELETAKGLAPVMASSEGWHLFPAFGEPSSSWGSITLAAISIFEAQPSTVFTSFHIVAMPRV
eukprot:600210-Prymnesium_polylepis.1